jgi:hypothetical protein
MKKLTTLLVLIACAGIVSAQIPLRYTLKQGQSFKIMQSIDQFISQDIMGMKQDMQQTIKMGTRYDVTAVAGDVYTVKCTYYRVAMNMNAMGMEMSYDSDNPSGAADPMSLVFAALVNQSFTMKFNTAGDILGISGVDVMINNMIGGMGLTDPEQEAATREQLSAQYGDEAMMNSMEQVLKIFPASGKGNKGETWSTNVKMPGFNLDLNNQYQLSDFDNVNATMKVTSLISPTTIKQNQGGMEMEMEMSGSQNGIVVVERATGMVMKSTMTQDITAKVNAMGMSWPMTIKSTIAVNRE